MKNLEAIAEDLFNKIRGRFPSVTIGDENAEVTNDPKEARYFDFEYKEGDRKLGKVSVSLDEKAVAVMYSNDFVANEDTMTQNNWYSFLKELRQFSKKRLLNFDTRNITKSNLDRRDYKFLAQTRAGETQMTESTMYGTHKTSFQNIGNAKLSIKHNQQVNGENPVERTRYIGSIYVENSDGERFKYPFRHLTGARAMARHVSEGGTPYDTFGTHITGMSEELSKLRKFKTYLGRSSVMAESLAGYVDIVKERIDSIKKNLKNLQKETYYKETFESFQEPVFEEVPDEVKENWIDELTIKQFNEELADVFPYIYRLIGEATRAKELGPDDLDEAENDRNVTRQGSLDKIQGPADTVKVRPGMTIAAIARAFNDQNNMGGDLKEFEREIMQLNNITDPSRVQAGQVLRIPYAMGTGRDGAGRGLPPGGFTAYEDEIESAFEDIMGQFSESAEVCEECGNPNWSTFSESEKQKGLDGKACWKGYRRQGTKMKGGKRVDNCVKVGEDDTEEGNAYANAVRQAKMNGKKKGDKVKGPDGDEITLEKDKKTPLGEFILSYFDYTSGQFPKGETAVLTMIEKDYGEQFITPAKQFIEKINTRVAEVMGYKDNELDERESDLNTYKVVPTPDGKFKVIGPEHPVGMSGAFMPSSEEESDWGTYDSREEAEKEAKTIEQLYIQGLMQSPAYEELDRFKSLAGL